LNLAHVAEVRHVRVVRLEDGAGERLDLAEEHGLHREADAGDGATFYSAAYSRVGKFTLAHVVVLSAALTYALLNARVCWLGDAFDVH
jgi:hypothetical protein